MSLVQRAFVLMLCLLLSGQGTALARHLDNAKRHHPPAGHTDLLAINQQVSANETRLDHDHACKPQLGCIAAAQLALRSEPSPHALAPIPAQAPGMPWRFSSVAPTPPEHRPKALLS